MKKKRIVIIIVSLVVVISVVSVLLIKNFLIVNINPDNVSKIVYHTSPDPTHCQKINITDKDEIKSIIELYNGSVYKYQSYGPNGDSINLVVYNGSGNNMLRLSSFGFELYSGDNYYRSLWNTSDSDKDKFDQKIMDIMSKYNNSIE